jgi:hypothetical protein
VNGSEPKTDSIRIYHEDDWVARVEILEDQSDSKRERYRLKVLCNLRQTMMYRPVEVGTVFDVDRVRGKGRVPGLWWMEKETVPSQNKE